MGRRESWTEGEGVNCQDSAEAWERKSVNPVKKFGEGIHTTPPKWVNTRWGGGKGECRGTQGYPLFAGWGGSESHHTQKEREVKKKESERKMKGVCLGEGGRLRVGRGDLLHPTVRARARRAVAERPALSSGRAPSFLWAAGGDSDRPPPFPFRAGGKGVCVCVSVLGGPGFTPRPALSPAPREAASFHLGSPAPPGRAGGKTKGD